MIYSKENKLSPKKTTELKDYLFVALERKKLQRTKDIAYDTISGKIKNIPGLDFNKNKNKFTLKRVDRKTSTLKNLQPKRKIKKKDRKATEKKKEKKEKKKDKKEKKEKKRKKRKKGKEEK